MARRQYFKEDSCCYGAECEARKISRPIAPFGYLVGDTEDRLPVVDETNAPYVRMMYKMRSEGASSPQIAKALNAQGVITPSDYTYKRLGKPNPYLSNHL